MSPAACSSSTPVEPIAVTANNYDQAFESAKRELVRLGFTLERIDARAGIIETQPKPTSGLATPWDVEQRSLAQEWQDFTSPNQRIIRVTFAPVGYELPTTPSPSPPMLDLRSVTGPIEMNVTASIYRLRIPGRRIETEAIALSSRSTDPQRPRLSRPHLTPVSRDEPLADVIRTRIDRSLRSNSEPSE